MYILRGRGGRQSDLGVILEISEEVPVFLLDFYWFFNSKKLFTFIKLSKFSCRF